MGIVIALLSVLLLVQVGAVVLLERPSDELATFNAARPLVDVNAADVDELIIDGDGKELVIKREDGRWVLPDQGRFPVSAKKLDGFLKKLLAAKPSWPVGTTQVAAKQLEVSPDAFERKIQLLGKGAVLSEVYLGSSPGYRKVHARLEGSPNTHVIDFNAFDAATNPESWRDGDLLRLSEGDLEKIDMGAFALARGENGFEPVGMAENEQREPDAVAEVVRAVTTLHFTDELGDEGKKAFDQGELILEFSLKPKDREVVKYTVVAPAQADHYILKASNLPYFFAVPKKQFDDLRAVERKQLVQAKAETVESPTSKGEEGTADVKPGSGD